MLFIQTQREIAAFIHKAHLYLETLQLIDAYINEWEHSKVDSELALYEIRKAIHKLEARLISFGDISDDANPDSTDTRRTRSPRKRR